MYFCWRGATCISFGKVHGNAANTFPVSSLAQVEALPQDIYRPEGGSGSATGHVCFLEVSTLWFVLILGLTRLCERWPAVARVFLVSFDDENRSPARQSQTAVSTNINIESGNNSLASSSSIREYIRHRANLAIPT